MTNETQEQMLAGLRIYTPKDDRAKALGAGGNRLTITDIRSDDGNDLYVVLVAGFARKEGDETPWIFPLGAVVHITERDHVEAGADATAGRANELDKAGWSSALIGAFDKSAVAAFSKWEDGKLFVEYVAIGRVDPGIKVLYRGWSEHMARAVAKQFSE